MILGLELILFFYVVLAAAFRLVARLSVVAALLLLTISSILILAAANLTALFYLSGQIAVVISLYGVGRLFPNYARSLAWLAFLGLIPFNLHLWLGPFEILSPAWMELGLHPDARILWFVGSSFFVVKSFVCLRESLRDGRLHLLPTLASLTFLPAYPAGPITGCQPYMPRSIARNLDPVAALRAIMRLGWGLAAFYVIAPYLRRISSEDYLGYFDPLGDMYLDFAALYFDFSGYSLVAISMAAFYGVTLPENFNKPYLAKSIREFWQRWHMSLGWFVGTYLFKPFVRVTGSPRKGIFLAFVLVGIWHEAMLGYLVWGIGHGFALSLAMQPPALWGEFTRRVTQWLADGTAWFLTMSWVAILSSIANSAVWRFL